MQERAIGRELFFWYTKNGDFFYLFVMEKILIDMSENHNISPADRSHRFRITPVNNLIFFYHVYNNKKVT